MTNFEDDLFIIVSYIRVLTDAVRLELSAELFASKIASDLGFVNAAMEQLFGELQGSTHLIQHPVYLKSFLKGERDLKNLLDALSDSREPITGSVPGFRVRLDSLKNDHQQRILDAQKLVSQADPTSMDDRFFVSADEYKLLLDEEPPV